MKKRVLSILTVLSLFASTAPWVNASPNVSDEPGTYTETEAHTDAIPVAEPTVPTPQQACDTMIAMQSEYPEGMAWTDASSGTYKWNGGRGENGEIAEYGTGCVNFAFRLSDAVFGTLPARMYRAGTFRFEDIKAGDILRVEHNRHSVIVLQTHEETVVIAEGNYNKSIHWGRILTRDEVLAADHVLTRYPEGYLPPDDPSAGEIVAQGTLDGGLTWQLVRAGTLTISGAGAMPDFTYGGTSDAPVSDRPWNEYMAQIQKIVLENGITRIGSNAFRGSTAFSISIPASVTEIGNDAFRGCASLTLVSPDGVVTIGERAFQGCENLRGVTLPASIEEVGAGAFCDCTELTAAKFLPGENHVIMGDNVFTRCWRLVDVTLPGYMDKIGNEMFLSNTGGFSSLTIPEGVESIGERAFSNCYQLTSLYIPGSVKTIGTSAFTNCGLKDIYFSGSETEWNAIQKPGDTQSALDNITVHYDVAPPDEDIAVTEVRVSPTSVTVAVDGTAHLTAEVIPANASDAAVSWYSSDLTVTAVDENGVVTGIGVGTATIVASAGDKYAECTVTVEATAPDPGPDTPDPEPDTPDPGPDTPDPEPDTPDPGPDTPDPKPDTPSSRPDSSNSGSDTSSPSPTTMVSTTPAAGDAGKPAQTVAAPPAAVNGTTAVCTVSSAVADEMIRQALQYKSGAIKITPEINGTVTRADVTIPAASLNRMGNRTAAGMTVSTPLAEVAIPNSGLKSLSRSGGNVVIAAERTGNSAELTITAGGQTVRKVSGGVTMTIPMDNPTPGTVAVLVNADGTRQVIRRSVANETGVTVPLDGSARLVTEDNAKTFTDVPPTNWAADAVAFVSGHELFNGTAPDIFSPDVPMTRGMLVTVLHNLENNPRRTSPNSFSDVPSGAWYANAVAWAVDAGIVSGYGNGQFGAEDRVTREQMAVMLWRYAGSPASAGSMSDFHDAGQSDEYASEALRWAAENGIIHGKNGNLLDPKGRATRAEVAQMLKNFLEC